MLKSFISPVPSICNVPLGNKYHLQSVPHEISFASILFVEFIEQKLVDVYWFVVVILFNSEELKRSMKYASHTKTVEALKKAGFIPIEIAGVYSRGINFMNAIVNSHPDGTISYITNSTSCKNPFISKLQEEFEADLRKKVPNIDKVYFVSGQKNIQTENLNYMMYNLNKRGGGLHCMTLEEVDFNAWG